nr:unnamed protein product [Digitaria exilis]
MTGVYGGGDDEHAQFTPRRQPRQVLVVVQSRWKTSSATQRQMMRSRARCSLTALRRPCLLLVAPRLPCCCCLLTTTSSIIPLLLLLLLLLLALTRPK